MYGMDFSQFYDPQKGDGGSNANSKHSYEPFKILPAEPNAVEVIRDLGIELGKNNQLLLENVQKMNQQNQMAILQMQQQIQRGNGETRRKKLGAELACNASGELFMIEAFEGGIYSAKPLLTNFVGPVWVCRAEFLGIEGPKNMIVFWFEKIEILFLKSKDKAKEQSIRDIFLRSGAKFNIMISPSKIGRVLYEGYAEAIEQTKKTWQIPALPGWRGRDFFDQNYMPATIIGDCPELPIMKKSFHTERAEETDFETYFSIMQAIPQWKDRIIVMTFPMLALLKSLMNEKQIRTNFSLNFVLLEDISVKAICGLLQVFNRRSL